MKAQTEAEVVQILGPVVFECQQKELLARKFARGELTWKDELIPAMFGIVPSAVVIAAMAFGDRPITPPRIGALALIILLFFLPAVIVAIRTRQMRRFAIHEQGLRFHWKVIPFSDIKKIEPAHPSTQRKGQANFAVAAGAMGVGSGSAAQRKLRYEFRKAFDIVLKEGSPIPCRYVAYHFDDSDVDRAMELLRASHPDFFIAPELRNLFSEWAARDNPADSFEDLGQK